MGLDMRMQSKVWLLFLCSLPLDMFSHFISAKHNKQQQMLDNIPKFNQLQLKALPKTRVNEKYAATQSTSRTLFFALQSTYYIQSVA